MVPSSNFLAIYGISMTTGVAADASTEAISRTRMDAVDNTAAHANIASGVLKLSVDTVTYLEDYPLANFANGHRTDLPKGYVQLDNLIFANENKVVKPEVDFYDITGLDLAVVRLGFNCVRFASA
jgi:hypothetical protein